MATLEIFSAFTGELHNDVNHEKKREKNKKMPQAKGLAIRICGPARSRYAEVAFCWRRPMDYTGGSDAWV